MQANLPVFITYGWCRNGYTVVRSLGQRGIEVHVGDASPLAMSRFSRYCRSFTCLPDCFCEPEEYFSAVCRALKKTSAGVLLPCHEDTRIFIKRRSELPEGVKVAFPDYKLYQQIEDKLDCVKPCWSAQLPRS